MHPIALPVKEAAALVGIPPTTLRKHGPKPVRLGRRNVWRVVDLQKWVDSLADGVASANGADEESRLIAALSA